jgi:hypothetical protein
MSYIIPRDHWCNIIVLNVHVPTEDKIDDIKDRFYEEREHVFDKFPKYRTKILLEYFSAKSVWKMKRNVYRTLMGKPEGKRPLGRPRRRWVDNIKMDLRDAGWDGVDWIDMAQDRD